MFDQNHVPSNDFFDWVFRCTFCNATFSTAGNWRRHEESVHLVASTWICAPDEQVYGSECVYCGEYLKWYRRNARCATECASKPIESRTFSRQDHLEHHLKTIHIKSEEHSHRIRRLAKLWKCQKPLPNEARCGFCDTNFQSWSDRQKHIVIHFESGVGMDQWRGDWCLSPEWMESLSAATLPEDRYPCMCFSRNYS
jgi:hypothetical protein